MLVNWSDQRKDLLELTNPPSEQPLHKKGVMFNSKLLLELNMTPLIAL
jgi:hypothetical protein